MKAVTLVGYNPNENYSMWRKLITPINLHIVLMRYTQAYEPYNTKRDKGERNNKRKL